MKIKTETTVTVTLTADEVSLICAALGSHHKAKTNVFTNHPITQQERNSTEVMRVLLSESIPYNEGSGAIPD